MRKGNFGKIFVFVLIGLFAIMLIGPNILGGNKKSSTGTSSNTTSSTPSQIQEIPFTHEGYAAFVTESDTIVAFDIEIADNQYETSRGLMDRRSMPADQAMLFIFPAERMQSFWMRNTYISLDIIYLDKDLKVVSIQKYAQPFNETSLPSEGPAQYVLEVNAGICDQYNIDKGSQLSYTSDPIL